MLSEAKYAEFFPRSLYIEENHVPLFGEYAQAWLNGRDIVKGTRSNYLWAFNLYWMPHLALIRVDKITSPLLRKIIAKIDWPSPGVKRSAIQRLGTVLKTAMHDDILTRNPVESIELPRLQQKEIDPFTVEEASQIITHLYTTSSKFTRIYAAYFEFAFATGMRPSEIMALRWDEVNLDKRVAYVCRIVANRTIHERTKNKKPRFVLLDEQALHALSVAREIATENAKRKREFSESLYVFPPSKGHDFIRESSVTDKHFKLALAELQIRDRPQYNCRHTRATMCLMAGMNPAFIAKQLGHTVQILLTRYARWINSEVDWKEMAKLENGPIGTKLVRKKTTLSETREIEPLDFHR